MFNGKNILITGGSSGIGKSTALLFASKGANIAITYKSNREGAEETAEEIRLLGVNALVIQANLINEEEAEIVVKQTLSTFGKIDVLVNNAGRYIDGDEWNGTSEIWVKSLEQNLVSMMNVSKYIVEQFLIQQSGIMVNIASRYCIDGQPESLAYAAAKAGVVNITQAYAKLLSLFGRANCVSPGAVKAGYWLSAPEDEVKAQNKLIEPEKIAEQIVFLASDEAKEINGQNILITQ